MHQMNKLVIPNCTEVYTNDSIYSKFVYMVQHIYYHSLTRYRGIHLNNWLNCDEYIVGVYYF